MESSQTPSANMETCHSFFPHRAEHRVSLRPLFQYALMMFQAERNANRYPVYTYSSALENDSPLFSMPGDYFIYVIFVGTVIVVSHEAAGSNLPQLEHGRSIEHVLAHITLALLFYLSPRIICPPSLFLAAAVPGNEGDYPCTLYSPSFAKKSLRGCIGCGNGGIAYEIAVVNYPFYVRWLWCPTFISHTPNLYSFPKYHSSYAFLSPGIFRVAQPQYQHLLTFRKLTAGFLLGGFVFTGGE